MSFVDRLIPLNPFTISRKISNGIKIIGAVAIGVGVAIIIKKYKK